MRNVFVISAAFCVSIPVLTGQELPGCEARTEVQRAFNSDLSGTRLSKLKWSERQALETTVINDLIAKFPREIAPHLRMIRDARWNDLKRWTELQRRYRGMATARPDDPLALSLAAAALFEADTPESIRLAELARVKAPQFPYPALFLASAYSEGLRADKEKFGQNLRAYFTMCPGSADPEAMWVLPKLGDSALQGKVVAVLRTRLASETDPIQLTKFGRLWALEFRTTPPAGHDALRKQVAEDVKRLESLNAHPDAVYFDMLLKGYKQSGASKEARTAFEDRVLREAPVGTVAYSIAYERWKKENKEPDNQTDRAAWVAYNARLLEKTREWERQFTSVPWLASMRVDMLFEDDKLTEKEGVAVLEAPIAHEREWEQPDSGTRLNEAEMLLKRKWRPDWAMNLLAEARVLSVDSQKLMTGSDNMTAERREEMNGYADSERYGIAKGILKAALLLHKPEAAEAVRAQVEVPLAKASKRFVQSTYWRNRALLALVDQHQADALTYFQLALQVRPEAPKMYHGRLQDPLMDEVKELWKQLGGTEAAFVQWSTPAETAMAGEQKQGRWEKPTKELPAFELSDLSGKTWRLKAMEGKVVMISLWATWCGPCRSELPEFQKLYEKVKDRSDVQVITFNIDSELGMVSPFMKENGYTFPVLLAYDFTRGLLDGIAIPQNWVVDGQGKWRWTQLGYGAEPDWPGEMMKRLEATK